MPRGIGPAQQAVLQALADSEHTWLSTAELTAITGHTDRRLRELTDALAQRKLIVITRQFVRWRGEGEYGPLKPIRRWERNYGYTVNLIVEAGELWPSTTWNFRARERTEFHHIGVPTYGRCYWLTERWEQDERVQRAWRASLRQAEEQAVRRPALRVREAEDNDEDEDLP